MALSTDPEQTIIIGLGILTAIFSFIAFEFLHKIDNDEGEKGIINWTKIIGVLCFILVIVFVNIIMYACVLIAQNSSISYLNDTVLLIGMQAVMWATLAGMSLYVLFLVFGVLYIMYNNIMSWFKGRKKGVV